MFFKLLDLLMFLYVLPFNVFVHVFIYTYII